MSYRTVETGASAISPIAEPASSPPTAFFAAPGFAVAAESLDPFERGGTPRRCEEKRHPRPCGPAGASAPPRAGQPGREASARAPDEVGSRAFVELCGPRSWPRTKQSSEWRAHGCDNREPELLRCGTPLSSFQARVGVCIKGSHPESQVDEAWADDLLEPPPRPAR